MHSVPPTSIPDTHDSPDVSSTVLTTPDRSASCSPSLDEKRNTLGGAPSNKILNANYQSSDKPSSSPRPIRSICCVGAGYVGGPTAAVLALKNPSIKVTVVDRDERRIRRWNSRHLPIYEPGLAEVVRIARDGLGDTTAAHVEEGARTPNLFFSVDVSRCISEADAVLIAVNTPTKMRGTGKGCATDMTSFEAVAAEVVRHARDGTIIVEKSTVPCKTAQMIQEMIHIQRPGAQFEILSNPEFLAAGTAVQDLIHPDRIIIGSATTPEGQAAAQALAEVYASWIERSRIITTNVWSSELAKLVANSMLAQRLSSINSISALCEATGAEINEVSRAIGADTRLGSKFLRAGIGFGGSCFKKDVLSLVYLAESLGLYEVGAYWRQVVEMNEYQRDRFASRVIKRLNSTLVTKKICVLGYAFKKNTSDTREAPALEIIKTLLDENPREIAIFDPCCNPMVIEEEVRALQKYGPPLLSDDGGCVKIYSDAYAACADSNAILLVTEFDEFMNFPVPASRPAAKAISSVQAALPDKELSKLRFNEEPGCAADTPTMRAWVRPYRGPAKILQLSDVPTPAVPPSSSSDVLIRVSHVSLTYNTELIMKIIPNTPLTRPWIPEIEFSGDVIAAGTKAPPEVRDPGVKVFGCESVWNYAMGHGVLAEYVCVPGSNVVRASDEIDMASASGINGCGSCALKICRTAGVEEGHVVLVNGASGSVGSVLVQLCKFRGAKVVGVASGRNEEMVRGLGVDEFVDYRKHDSLPAYMASQYGDKPFDFILDCVGTQALYANSSAYLKPEGALINVGLLEGIFTTTFNVLANTFLPQWLGGVPRRYITFSTPPTRDAAVYMAELVRQGHIRIPVDSVYDMEDAIAAYERVATQRARGKVVIKVRSD